jgi:hypothetical protein
VKLSVVGVTVRLTVAVVFDELVGAIVIVVGPDAVMFGRVEIVTVVVASVVPLNVTLGGLKLQAAPVGKPVQLLGLKFTTVPVEPLTGEMVRTDDADCPAETELGFKVLADSAKSGSNEACQAAASAVASTEPSPVT